MSQRAWSWAWGLWLASTISSFMALETLALHRKCLPTLSGTLARWMGIAPVRRRGKILPIAFLAFWTWLTVHVVQYRNDVERDPR